MYKIYLIAFIFFFFQTGLVSAAGLKFNRGDVSANGGTSYDVFDGFEKIRGESLGIEFDISFYNLVYFGNILSCVSEKGSIGNILFVNFREQDEIFIRFRSASNPSGQLDFSFNKKELRPNMMHHIKVEFDLKNKLLIFGINDQLQIMELSMNERFKTMQFIFGLHQNHVNIPGMIISNVKINNGKKTSHFALNEFSGNEVYDENGKAVGVVTNGEWEINRHHNWEKKFSVFRNFDCAITHDWKKQNIIIYNKESTLIYHIAAGVTTEIENPPSMFGINSGSALYSPVYNDFLIYNLRPPRQDKYGIARFDYVNESFHPLGKPYAVSSLHHCNTFLDKSNDKLYLFGGFGNSFYSNDFYYYDQASDSFVKDSFSGDFISPRYFSGSGNNYRNDHNELYIFGGYGNESGRKEEKGKFYYDFFRIDMQEKKISRLFELQNIHEDFVPAQNIIISEKEDCFYAFCYFHYLHHSVGQLYRFSMDGSSYEPVSNTLAVFPEKIKSKIYLFYNEKTAEIYLVKQEFFNKEDSHVDIYSIAFPPVLLTANTPLNDKPTVIFYYSIVAGIASLILILFLIWLVKIRRKKHVAVSPDEIEDISGVRETREQEAECNLSPNTVYILGNFVVTDKKGQDISYRFSNKIRQIFIYILIHSYDKYNGVTPDMLTDVFWPDKNGVTAKNIRGVTLKSIRDILEDIDGIDLVKKQSKWMVVIDPSTCICDYINIIRWNSTEIENSIAHNSFSKTILPILSRGNLPQFEWIDKYKSDFEEKLLSLLIHALDYLLAKKDYTLSLQSIAAILQIDPLNVEIFKKEYSILGLLGKNDMAQSKYRKFSDSYFKAYNIRLKLNDLQ